MEVKKEKSFEEDLLELAADTVVTYIGLSIMAELLVKIARDLDEDNWVEISEQFEAMMLYPDYAMKPEV